MQLERFDYWQIIRAFDPKNLIFIDESGVNLCLNRLLARALKGQRARGNRPSSRGKNVSVIGALSLKGVIAQVSLLGAIDGLTFEAFIAQRLVPQLWPGAFVLMDNCSIHKGAEIRALIEQAGATLIYLPRYSPDFSPIENAWSKIKQILRSIKARNYPDLALALESAFNQISLENIRNWFSHCCYRISLE
ncbi:transposase [Neosynechococcus sphagnicola sy1]|uniref:Transposase n=2 Tax=Neosynechococcus sphagnicola sy1 TaxID=1497020 RepID=A0A098TGK1_9CYAN|nr:IS630 family transposase [Neosynechococcus sphagnicola]KGF71715.1 transposase [Neosynechococcus sphagnicola sy1]